ncbi:LytR family transcriptional attenuator [Herbihabitans rhizosphaerae]|uniref:LytR family transcriptional attenuator n=2 Tax=Herbihabitans rhizosphaerae TaxID=1872711 RepID=A0A4Q7KK82_9PSEU|nr:LytR family transcriptional attenuator [Herbihabitans rhizosphaerae]
MTGSRVSMIEIPRDVYAEISGNGRNKISAAWVYGGGQSLAETVTKLTGVEIEHRLEIDMSPAETAKSLVDKTSAYVRATPGLDLSARAAAVDARTVVDGRVLPVRGYTNGPAGAALMVDAGQTRDFLREVLDAPSGSAPADPGCVA